jgi:hypothetical protein
VRESSIKALRSTLYAERDTVSYEGYEQALCEKGHYHEFDCRDNITEFVCDAVFDDKPCGSKIKTVNDVDETNCDGYGHRKRILLTEATYQVCNLGGKHLVSEATYKLSDTRYYRETEYDGEGNATFKYIPYCEDSSIND